MSSILTIQDIAGGIAESPTYGTPNQMAKIWGADYRSKPGVIKLARTLDTEEDNTGDIDDLLLWMVKDADGDIYAQGDTGRLYARPSGGVVYDLLKAVSSSTGEGLGIHTILGTRQLLYARDATLGKVALPDATSASTFTDSYQTLTSEDFHPISVLSNLACIGNGANLATIDDSGNFDADRVQLATGFHIRCQAQVGEYLVMGAWRGQNFHSGEGRLYFWDGGYGNWNFFEPIPDGGPNFLVGGESELFLIAGNKGAIYRWTWGRRLEFVRYIPKDWQLAVDEDGIIAFQPSAGARHNGLVYFGLGVGHASLTDAGNTTAEDVKEGIYSFGSNRPGQPESLNLEHRIGADDSNTHEVGCVGGFGSSGLFVSHKQTTTGPATTYYAKRLADDASPYATATSSEGIVQSQFQNLGESWRKKLGWALKITFNSLPASTTIEATIYVDGATTGTSLGTETTTGDTEVRFPINVNAFREILVELKVSTSAAGSTPEIRDYTLIQEAEGAEV